MDARHPTTTRREESPIANLIHESFGQLPTRAVRLSYGVEPGYAQFWTRLGVESQVGRVPHSKNRGLVTKRGET